MSSQPPTLPPSMIAGASAQAKIDQIMVRIINLPENTRGGTSPTKLSGTVAGQNTDGTLSIKTDRGEVRILLSDKGNLPQGLKIDIEIPAGRNPQQASIRTSETSQPLSSQPQSSSPSLQQTLQQQPQNNPAPVPQRPQQQIEPATLGKIIVTSQTETTPNIASAPIPIAGGALQAGQMIRLIPIPPADLSKDMLSTLTKPVSFPTLITGLVDIIENLPISQNQLRTNLINLLSRLDFSGFQTGPQNLLPSSPLLNPLMIRINMLLQSGGLPPAFIQNNSGGTPSAQNASLLVPTPQALSLFNPSKSIDGQVLSFQPSTSTLPLSIATPVSNTPVSTAQVLGITPAGLPVLSIPLPHTGLTQVYTMQFGANNINTGTPVFIALDPISTKGANTLFIQTADGSINLNQLMSKPVLDGWINSATWDSLDDLLKNMSHISPTNAHSFSQMIPTPAQPNSMGALSMFFLSVMRSGDADGWIQNEAVNLLRQMGKADLIRNVSNDLALTSKLENIALPQDWRLTLLPMLWENQIHKLPVYYKHMPDDENKQDTDTKKRRKLRFLFDLNLSRMGGVQVDGFMQPERLDIILRTKSPLSPPMQSQMKRVYAGAMDKSRLTGDLSFQFKPEHWGDLSVSAEKTGLNA